MPKTTQRAAGRAALLAAALALPLAYMAPARAQDAGQRGYITGEEWQSSDERSKLAYVLGVADMMNAEHAYQSRRGLISNSRSTISRLHTGFSDVSIREAVARVDAFYAANPDQIDQTVLEALWITIVEEDS